MLVYRISHKRYVNDLAGTGAGLFGGRWNPIGLNLIYTAGSISLATLEYLVHNLHLISKNEVCLAKIQIEDKAPIEGLNLKDLPPDWSEKTYTPQSTQQIGERFIQTGKNYILKVPSAIVPDEFNLLLNPTHSWHQKTKIVEIIDPFRFDARLFQ